MKRNHTKILSVTLTAALIVSLFAIPTDADATKKLMVKSPKSVTVGKTIKIKTNMKCKYKSSNKKIATVSSKGVVKGKKAGKVKITVTAQSTKKKKTVSITVKKQPEDKQKEKVAPSPNVEETPNPSATVTQPPQGIVTQPSASTPSEGASQSPDIPRTPDPSVTSAPTSTATSSPTTPSETKQPIGITAEFEGKVPLNNTTSNQDVSMYFVNRMSVVVTVKYNDSTQRNLNFDEFLLDEGKIIEESGKKYVEKVATYEEFSAILRVEIVEVDSDILYPDSIMCDYTGDIIQKGKVPDSNDIVVKAIYDADQVKEVSADQLRIDLIGDLYETEGVKKYRFRLSYNYYFEFNGERLHTCAMGSIYVPYE